jgi:hypothetical protein
MGLVERREEVRWLRGNYQASQQRICGLMQIAVSSFRYRSTRSDEELRERLIELARKKPRFGYRRLHIHLDAGGAHVNHKRVYRVYREAGLAVRCDPKFRSEYLHRCHQKPKGVAKVAAARKLAIRLYWMLRTQKRYPEIVSIESSSRVALGGAS